LRSQQGVHQLSVGPWEAQGSTALLDKSRVSFQLLARPMPKPPNNWTNSTDGTNRPRVTPQTRGSPPSRKSRSSSASAQPHTPPPSPQAGFIPPHGGYEDLLSFQKARIVYDATVRFCERFIDKRSRTTDQMIQAARSGKQNILEGSQASGTSKEMEIKLTNVASASLEELLEDYRDYLRSSDQPQWDKNSKEAFFLRRLGRKSPVTYEPYRVFIETRPGPVAANIIISVIHQTNYLLDQQIRRLEQDFLHEGGLRERMTRARIATRTRL
jgi:four helix bundle suffix protein